jgi:signal transduction histidine kinase/DNA-binding response OmpR family regulator
MHRPSTDGEAKYSRQVAGVPCGPGHCLLAAPAWYARLAPMQETRPIARWRLGIREKFALVAMLLVLGACVALHWHLSAATSKIVVDHELLDLGDETELRCWEMVDAVNQLRALVAECADDPAELKKLLTHLKTPPTELPATNLPPQWWESVLAVLRLDAQGQAEPLFSVSGIQPPAIPEHALGNHGPGARVSPVLPADLPLGYEQVRVLGSPPPADAPLVRVPVMWGLCAEEKSGGTLAILLPLNVSRSPRHLSFLLDDSGAFLQHSALRKNSSEALTQPFRGLNLHDEARRLTTGERWSGQESRVQVQRGVLFRELPVPEAFFYLEGDASAGLAAAIVKADETDRPGYVRWAEKQRLESERASVQFGGAGIATRTVRLLARTEEALQEQRGRITAAYHARFPEAGADPVDWHKPVRLENADAQIVRFFLHLSPEERAGTWIGDEPPPDPALYFVYATFREELSESVDHEFREVRRETVMLGLAAGVAAFLVAMFFVRPLRRITRAAQRVTNRGSEPDSSQLQHQVETVRQSLPVTRRDEVGDIARALESLLRQVINGHERLRQLNADLESRVRGRTAELEEANTELRGLAAAKDAFLASVSHELRQPLNSIFGYLQFLELSSLDSEQSGDVAKVRSAATYLRRLIDDILDYQKIIMGGIELDPEPLDAAEFFAGLRDAMKPQAADRNNVMEFSGTDTLGTLRHDRARLQQVFVNLLSNACKFTEKGRVALTARREGTQIIVDVTDTGRGMTADEKKHLFTRFKKLAAREGNKTGTGLGLVISKGLCELMGGSITCESEFSRGTTFTVRIPADLPRRTEAPAPPPAAPSLGHPLVLVVDDDAGVRELMQRFLESKGYRVITAAGGPEGIAAAREHRPDAITLDVVLPGQDGWEVLSELKSDSATSGIPVIMVTFLEERQQGYALGAADYLVKPVAWDELSARLARLTGTALSGPVLVVDDDAPTRELFRRALERDGRTVIEAADGAAALALMQAQRPSLILLDLMMPVMDGFEFVEDFRRHAEWRDIPILVVTARHATAEERARLSGSVRAILEKGGSPSGDLLADIISLIRRHTSV